MARGCAASNSANHFSGKNRQTNPRPSAMLFQIFDGNTAPRTRLPRAHRDSGASIAQPFAGRDQKIDIIKSASEPAHHPPHEPNWQGQAQLPI